MKLLIWSYGSFFQRKILPLIKKNKKIQIEKIFTKKKILNKKINFVNSEKEFFKDIKSKYIYINSAQKFHFKNIKKSLNKRLNVICEKTLCSNHKETKKIINLAKKKKLKIYCTSYYIYHKAFHKIKNILNDKSLGNPRYCIAGFGFNNNFNKDSTYRGLKSLGGSAILDLGFYPLSLEYYLFNKFKKKIKYSNIINSKKLDIDISGDVLFEDNQFSRYYFWGYNLNYKNFIKIIFDKGELSMNFIFSKNVKEVSLNQVAKNETKIFKFKNLNQEEIAFNYYLDEKNKVFDYSEILGLSKIIDQIKGKKNEKIS